MIYISHVGNAHITVLPRALTKLLEFQQLVAPARTLPEYVLISRHGRSPLNKRAAIFSGANPLCASAITEQQCSEIPQSELN
jgi:hypothetical protein